MNKKLIFGLACFGLILKLYADGVIGIIIGQIAIPVISYFNIMTLSPSITGPLIGFFFSFFVGVFFGFYPAYKASRLDSVDALRSE